MRKIYKLGITLGATTSIVAPLTTIACDKGGNVNHNLTGAQIESLFKSFDTKELDKSAAYTPDSLKAAALDIKANSSNNKVDIWKGSLEQEAISSAINLVYQVAYGLGFKLEDEAKASSINIIDDALASKTDDEILSALGLTKGTPEAERALELAKIKVDPVAITQDQINYALKTSHGTHTIDSASDFKSFHLVANNIDDYKSANETGGSKGKWSEMFKINTWFQTDGSYNITLQRSDFSSPEKDSFIRVLKNTKAKANFASINQDKFIGDYAPFAEAILQKFLHLFQTAGGAIDAIGLPNSLTLAAKYVVDKIAVEETDTQGKKTQVIDFSKESENMKNLLNVLSDLNFHGTVNWLSLKTFYVGLDEKFKDDSVTKVGEWISNKDWFTSSASDAANASVDVSYPIMHSSIPSNDASIPNYAITGIKYMPQDLLQDEPFINVWMHGVDFPRSIFDPSKTYDENIQMNNDHEALLKIK